MRSVLCSAVLLLTAPTVALAQYPWHHQGPQGTLSGVLKLPAGMSNRACSDIKVEATNAQGGILGYAHTHAGKDRCSFTINHVDANVPVEVKVTGANAACPTGTTYLAHTARVDLKPNETKVVDVQLRCR